MPADVSSGGARRGPALRIDELELALGGHSVLDNVSFAVEAGTLCCLIGPNGGGKTSLIRSLLGQMPHTGRITIDWPGERIIGYVPQRLDFDPTLPITVENFLATTIQRRPTFLGLSRAYRGTVERALATVAMADKSGRRIGDLSGGERQRVLFAQALIPMPSLLVLDEPLTGLDQTGAATIERVVLELRDDGVTVLWAHHDLAQVKRIADRVICLDRTVIFAGPPTEVLTPDAMLRVFSPSLKVTPARSMEAAS